MHICDMSSVEYKPLRGNTPGHLNATETGIIKFQPDQPVGLCADIIMADFI